MQNTFISLVLLATSSISSILGTTTYYNTDKKPEIAPTSSFTNENIQTNEQALEYAKIVFKDVTVMLKVAYCESGWKHWSTETKKPMVLWGKTTPNDRGFFQVNEHYHKEEALKLGFDIELPKDNIDYAMYLYKHYGLQPWKASKLCWSKPITST